MSRQAIVGAFTILGIVLLFVVYFFFLNITSRLGGYQVGVHFQTAAGLTKGAIVYESGVQVGSVSEIRMLDDFTVDIILQVAKWVDIPRDSQFIISAPLTGGATLTIVPPRQRREQLALLPRYVLPLDQQPRGTNPISVQDLLEAGRSQLVKLDQLMSDLTKREPVLMSQLQSAIGNVNTLTTNANSMLSQFSERGIRLTDSLQRSLDSASTNIVDLTDRLNETVRRNGGRIDALLISLNSTATSLSVASDQLRSLATNPQLRSQLQDTVAHIQVATANMAALSADLKTAAENSTMQGQLRDTVAHIDAASQRASSLLGALGGTSSVYGVDVGATPPPAQTASPGGGTIVPGTPPPSVPSAIPQQKKESGQVRLSPGMRDRIAEVAKNLFEVQLRISELTAKAATVQSNALLTGDRGPQSDFNVVVLPHGDQQLFAGVNDLSGNQTWNFAMRQRIAPGMLVGGGILYSRLGVLGLITNKVFGFEGLAYDPRYGYLDTYLRMHATPNIDLFVGERDWLHKERRTTYGLQYRFLGGPTGR